MAYNGSVTVTGGAGASPITLKYDADDVAFKQAYQLAMQVTSAYDTATAVVYNPSSPPAAPAHGGYLIVPTSADGASFVDARGYGAITIDNSSGDTVLGGGHNVDQTVLASDGGIDFRATAGNVTVVSGGGNNEISFNAAGSPGNADNTGDNAVYVSGTGDNTIVGGNGYTTIAASQGLNKIYTEGGYTNVITTGADVIKLGVGAVTVTATGGGFDSIYGGNSTLVFHNGNGASTVNGGRGSYTINGGVGGGFYRGGAAGYNNIYGGSGSATIIGGGAGDTLSAGTGAFDVIRAGKGNETLAGGTNATTFQLYDHKSGQIAGSTDRILNFNASSDTIKLLGPDPSAAIAYAMNHYTVSGSNSTFLLEDGTKVTLVGYTGGASAIHFT